jgi:hypothetical protein
MTFLRRVLILALAILCSWAAAAAAEQTIGQWEVFELSLTARGAYANSYVEGLPANGRPLVEVTFSGVDGAAQGMRYTLAGFWDGGKTWKVRFAPPAAGQWSYAAVSSDAGLNGVEGTLRARA